MPSAFPPAPLTEAESRVLRYLPRICRRRRSPLSCSVRSTPSRLSSGTCTPNSGQIAGL